MMRQLSLVLVLGGTVALATGACTSASSNPPGQHDAGYDVHHQLDAGTQTDTGTQTDGGGGACTTNGFTVADDESAASSTDFFYAGYSSTSEPYDFISVELYYGLAVEALKGPGTVTLGSASIDKNYSSCSTCVLIRTACDSTNGCTGPTFFATEGTLNVTALATGGNFTGTLTNVKLVEVTIAQGTFVSTPVANGDVWCVASLSFDAPVQGSLPCENSTECSGSADTPWCDTANNECVQCLEEAHCTSLTDTPHCDTSSFSCVQCLQESHCTSLTATPHCDTTYFYCVQCLEEAHCTALTATPHCDTDYSECVECLTSDHCASNANGHFCAANLCGLCASMLDCTNPATPLCQLNETSGRAECVVGGTCTGDDAGEPGDDGPAGARVLTAGVGMTGSVCNADLEYDFYKITTSATGNLTFTLTWTDSNADLDLYVLDATGATLGSSEYDNPESVALTGQAAGLYYAVVTAYDMGTATDAIPYTITVTTQ